MVPKPLKFVITGAKEAKEAIKAICGRIFFWSLFNGESSSKVPKILGVFKTQIRELHFYSPTPNPCFHIKMTKVFIIPDLDGTTWSKMV